MSLYFTVMMIKRCLVTKSLRLANRIANMTEDKVMKITNCEEPVEWTIEAMKLFEEYDIEKTLIKGEKNALKKKLDTKQREKIEKQLRDATEKSKIWEYVNKTDAIQPPK